MEMLNPQNPRRNQKQHLTSSKTSENRKNMFQLFTFKENLKNVSLLPSKITLSLDFKLKAIHRDLSTRKNGQNSSLIDARPMLQKHGKLIKIDKGQRNLYVTIIRSLFKGLHYFKSEGAEGEILVFLNVLKRCYDAEYFVFCIYLIKKLLCQNDFDAYWNQMGEFQECVLNLFSCIVKSQQQNHHSRNSSQKKQCFFKSKGSMQQQNSLSFIFSHLNSYFQQATEFHGKILNLSKNILGSKENSKTDYIFRMEFFGKAISYVIAQQREVYAYQLGKCLKEEEYLFIPFSDIVSPLQKKNSNLRKNQDAYKKKLEFLAQDQNHSLKNIQTRSSSLIATLEQLGKMNEDKIYPSNLQPPRKYFNFLKENQIIDSLTFSNIEEDNEIIAQKKTQTRIYVQQ